MERFKAYREDTNSYTINEIIDQANLGRQLLNILINYVGERGDSESAVEVLERIIRERDNKN